jgi:tetratricopeptide (TPR) repeat protein
MKIVENLSALALRQLIDGATKAFAAETPGGVPSLRRLLTSQPDRFRAALTRAAEHSWRGLEVSLAGNPWWEQCRGQLQPDETALGTKVQAYLDAGLLGDLSRQNPALRRACLRELRAGLKSKVLTGELDASGNLDWLERTLTPETQDPMAADWRLVEQVADELRPGSPALAEFLTVRPADRQPLLAKAVRLFFRYFLETDSELAPLPAVASLPRLAHQEKAALAALADVLSQHAERLDNLLTLADSLPEESGLALEIEAETRSAADPIPYLGGIVVRGLRRLQLGARGLQPRDFVALSSEDERQRIKELASRIHALNEDLQRKLPALLHGLALLEATAGFLDSAQSDLMTAVGAVADPHARAKICFNAYRVALEQHNWQAALALLQQAVTLDAKPLALFPQDKFEPERIIGSEPSGVAFVCKHRSSGTRMVVKALWAEALAGEVAELFRESRMLEELDNPLLVRMRDGDYVDEAKRRPFLVTDFFDGTTLADYVRQHGPLAPADLLRIVRPAAELLLAAHERGILHRDLKPTSLLLRRDGTAWKVKLINFGLAPRPALLYSALAGPATWSRTTIGSSALGTLPYLAPEQLGIVDGTAAGPSSDVYSFGRLCYFALLGTAEPDDDERDTLPPPWRKLLGLCTARNLARRLPSFQAVLKRLGQLAAMVPDSPAPGIPVPAQGLPTTPSVDTEVLQNYLNRGMAFKQQGNFDRAVAAFTKALTLDPKLLAGYIKRGNVYLEIGDFDRAIADYTAVVRLDPNNAAALMNRGLAYTKKGAYDNVIADCTEAVRLDPKLATAYSIRATALWERGDRHRAIADYNLALRNDPKNALAYNGRGLAFAEEGDFDRAISDYTQALKNEPRLVVGYVNRGTTYRIKKQYDLALADLTRALRLDPRNVLAYYNRALVLMAKQAYEQAIADFGKVLQLDPQHPDAAARRDEAQRARSRLAAAGQPAAKTGERPPAKATVGAAAQGAQGKAGAATASPTVPKRRPTDAPAAAATATAPAHRPAPSPADQAEEERRQMRAAAYFANGKSAYDQEKFSQAIDHFTKALQVDPKDPLIYYHRGLAHVAQDDFHEALADFTATLRLNPKNPMAHYQRGIAHRLLGQHDQAIEDYTRALKLDPRLALAYRNRGQSYAAKGDNEKAKADFERAVRLDPTLAKEE